MKEETYTLAIKQTNKKFKENLNQKKKLYLKQKF